MIHMLCLTDCTSVIYGIIIFQISMNAKRTCFSVTLDIAATHLAASAVSVEQAMHTTNSHTTAKVRETIFQIQIFILLLSFLIFYAAILEKCSSKSFLCGTK